LSGSADRHYVEYGLGSVDALPERAEPSLVIARQ
jgi:hypothetical protein